MSEKAIQLYGKDKIHIEEFEYKEDPIQNLLEFIFFPIDQNTILNISNSLEIPLYNDTSME